MAMGSHFSAQVHLHKIPQNHPEKTETNIHLAKIMILFNLSNFKIDL